MMLFNCCSSKRVHIYDPSTLPQEETETTNPTENRGKDASRFSLKRVFTNLTSSSKTYVAPASPPSVESVTNTAQLYLPKEGGAETPETLKDQTGDASSEDLDFMGIVQHSPFTSTDEEVKMPNNTDSSGSLTDREIVQYFPSTSSRLEPKEMSPAIQMLHMDEDMESMGYSGVSGKTINAWNAVYAADLHSKSGGSPEDGEEILSSLTAHKHYFESNLSNFSLEDRGLYLGGQPSLKEHIDTSINKVIYPSYSSTARRSVLPEEN